MAVVDISNTYQLTNVGAHIDNTDVYNSNRNLLDNPWWGSGEVVNQRGVTSGTTANNVFSIDRWSMSYGSTVGSYSLGTNGMTITAASGTYALFQQLIDNYAALTGKTVTCSALLSNGTIISGTVANLNWANNPIVVTSEKVRLQLLAGGYFRLTILNGGPVTIRAVKLELGSYSTLANDTAPVYLEELEKCQWHFRRVKGDTYTAIGLAVSSTAIEVPFPFAMRAAPTVTVTGNVIAVGTGGILNLGSVNAVAATGIATRVRFNITGATAYQPYILSPQNGGYIDFSTD